MLLINQQLPQSDVFGALRLALMTVLGDIEVIKGLSNRVPQPNNNYIAMTPIIIERLSTNESVYKIATSNQITRQESQDNDYTIQLDFYGSNSSNNAIIINSLWRSDYLFRFGITPMFSSNPRQMFFKGGENQMVERWTIDVHLYYSPKIILLQESANKLDSPTFYPVIG
jgi:hypothetical protein